jgi:hypothetical protein
MKYIVTLDVSKILSLRQARESLEQAGITIIKHFKPGFTFLVDAQSLDSVEHVVGSAPADATVDFQGESYTTDHLKLLVDPTGQKGYQGTHAHELFKYTGKAQTVYLMDTGVNAEIDEFDGADIETIYSAFPDSNDNAGHGTSVASLIVGQNIGTAPTASLKVLKIFDTNKGQILLSDLIEAFNALAEHHEKTFYKIKVICLPWVITQNDFLDAYIRQFDQERLVVVAAAGNQGVDVNTLSPAGVEEIITVGAHDYDFAVSQFSNTLNPDQKPVAGNFGAQVDIFAPGQKISVATKDNTYAVSAGTSLGAGIVAGVVTHYLEDSPAESVPEIKTHLIAKGIQEGPYLLNFDNTSGNIDYSSVNAAITKTFSFQEESLSQLRGRIAEVQASQVVTLNLGIQDTATDVAILDFAVPPPWITVDLATGNVIIDTNKMDDKTQVPGIYMFAIRGTLGDTVMVEEYSVGVYAESDQELVPPEDDDQDSAPAFYYDGDLGEYDKILDFQTSTQKF